MNFILIPTAEASITTLVNNISRVIINPIILFLFAAAIAYFIYGIAQYLLNPDNEEIRKKSKSQMVSGVIGLFIMIAVFGIMTLIKNTIGAKDVVIQQSGEVSTDGYLTKDTGSIDNLTGVGTMTLSECNTSRNIWDTYNQICTLNTGNDSGATGNDVGVTGDSGATGVGSMTFDECNNSRNIWNTYKQICTLNTGEIFQPTEGIWYNYTGYGIKSTGDSDQSTVIDGIDPLSKSTKNSKLIGKYPSDASFYRVVDSGVSTNLDEAKRIALDNALIDIAILKGLTSTIGIQYRVLEQTEFPLDYITKMYDSFIAIESPKDNVRPPSGSSSYPPSGSSSYPR